jgi:hypothetical protein
MISVQFNDASEFCDEIEKEYPNIVGSVVRTTRLYKTWTSTPNIRNLFVVSTFPTTLQDGNVCVIRMDQFCGSVWGLGHDDIPETNAESAIQLIEKRCEKFNLEIRPGIFTQEDTKEKKHGI